jgi:hypothetical protein
VNRPTGTDALDGDGFGTLCAWGEGFLGRVEACIKKSVHQGRLAEAGLACRPQARSVSVCCVLRASRRLRRQLALDEMKRGLTDDHNGEMEALFDRLSVDLVGQVCKPNKAGRAWVRLGRDTRAEWEVAHAWSFLRTAVGMPGVAGVTGLSPYSDMAAAAAAVAVDGEDEMSGQLRRVGGGDDGGGRTGRIYRGRL